MRAVVFLASAERSSEKGSSKRFKFENEYQKSHYLTFLQQLERALTALQNHLCSNYGSSCTTASTSHASAFFSVPSKETRDLSTLEFVNKSIHMICFPAENFAQPPNEPNEPPLVQGVGLGESVVMPPHIARSVSLSECQKGLMSAKLFKS